MSFVGSVIDFTAGEDRVDYPVSDFCYLSFVHNFDPRTPPERCELPPAEVSSSDSAAAVLSLPFALCESIHVCSSITCFSKEQLGKL